MAGVQALDDDFAGRRHRQDPRGRLSIRSSVSTTTKACLFLFWSTCSLSTAPCVAQTRIAVIGGGISGTFVSKYLVDLDLNCSLDALVIYDPLPIGQLSFSSTSASTSTSTSATTTTTQDNTAIDNSNNNNNNNDWQSSRVATVEVDGHIVELGPSSHSLVLSEFLLVRDMATKGGLRLQPAPRPSISLYNGNGDWAIHTKAVAVAVAVGDNDDDNANANANANANYWNLLWRYTTDYYKIQRATKLVTDGMRQLSHDMLQDDNYKNQQLRCFDSPEQMYQAVRLWPMVMHSLANVADALGVTQNDNNVNDLSWWRRRRQSFYDDYLPHHQGSLRQELLTAMSFVYYHQDPYRINGISGLLAWHYYVTTTTSTSTSTSASLIEGGNIQLLSTAVSQAQTNQKAKCRANNNNNNKPNTNNDVVRHVQQRISTVVGKGVQGFDLYAHDGVTDTDTFMGAYDVVILAAPFSTTQIEFLIQSHMDESVLQAMPLGGLVVQHDNDEEDDTTTTIPNDHHGHEVLPPRLPGTLTRPYTQVVVTIVRQARLQTDYFSLDSNNNNNNNNNNTTSNIPNEIYMTAKGMEAEHNVTAIFQLFSNNNDNGSDDSDGMLYKVYSSEPLTMDVWQTYFGKKVKVAFQKVWGGTHGGMVPDYQGQGQTTDFLLYDGATGLRGHTNAGALYFPNALEASFSNMETCAMGAKAVAKLIAKRMEWTPLNSEDTRGRGEEL